MNWFERRLEWLRSLNPFLVNGVLALAFTILGLASVFNQEIKDGLDEPGVPAILSVIFTCAPVAIRRRTPLLAVSIASLAILIHVAANYPEGSLPLTVMFLTYSVAVLSSMTRAWVGLGAVYAAILLLFLTDAPGLDALGVLGNLAFFGVAWAIGIAMRARRETLELRLSEAEERANVERQSTARVLAEERLRIAQELHDVVAHSMSVIAVQAGVGAHVLADRPDQARAALDAISATSRGTLTEMRRLLGVLRDSDGERAHAPAPGLADVPRLVDDVHNAGVPVTLNVEGSSVCVNGGVELSAYRVVQEALTNVMKHAGTTTRVDVTVQYLPGSLAVEIVDDGRGAAAATGNGGSTDNGSAGSGHGLVGMRERVELWGGELSAGPVSGGGYRVKALLPYGDTA
ncbi:MAG TPA: sensor histidine kinase [Ilumatobacteraceae bacterium]|nr:sensor histidine kinase [Ilumatobacteraceae bacterium]